MEKENNDYVGYRLLLKPTEDQKRIFNEYFGATRFVYNWALNQVKVYYNDTKNDNSIKIALASVDKSFLEKIKLELQSNAPISDFEDKNGFKHSEFRFSSAKIKQRLADFGIIPNKTYESFFPQNIPNEYLIDFIRGYFDGDGSVSTAGQSLRFQICGYNKTTLENFINFFYEKYAIPKVNVYKRNNTYYFQYSTSSTKKIFDFLYYKDCFYLPRKYDKYKNLIMK